MADLLYSDITDKVLKAFYTVYNKLGFGFLEKVYENALLLELLEAAEGLIVEHELQLINYLKATDLEVGLLLNFGKKPEFRRKVFSNDKKNPS
jgi:hypothetical protein